MRSSEPEEDPVPLTEAREVAFLPDLPSEPDFLSDLDELHTILLFLSEYIPIQLDTELFTLEAIAEAYFRRAYELLI